eukprot:TRINITY_DN14239_c0_g1_i1.p1 TRINITY_DN14239_c0_g1~~TRINITY_DN14239_c0_g1_i1.p1  ORF type:complete len:464 (+),score=90.07 TRINITY_DN14239_c0_g1_i1:51-1442(+)
MAGGVHIDVAPVVAVAAGANPALSPLAQAARDRAKDAVAIDAKAIAAADALGPPEMDESTGLPRVLRSYVVHRDPEIFLIPNFVTDGEIEHLLELAADSWIRSTTGQGVYKTNNETKDLKNGESPNRTSFSCMLGCRQTPTVARIEARLAGLAGLDADYLERLNMVRYAPGQFFNLHHDGRFRPKTIFIYCNDLPDGDEGETLFPELGVKIVPRKGLAVMWSNTLGPSQDDPRMVHVGLPPLTTMKYGVNCFFNDKPVSASRSDVETYHTLDPLELLDGDDAAVARGPGRPLRAFAVVADPKVLVVPHFMSPKEAQLLVRLAESASASQADLDAVVAIEARAAAVAGLPLAQMEPLRLGRCLPTMVPEGHVLKGGEYCQRYGRRVLWTFLNDLPGGGGELRFPELGLEIQVRAGCAVVWSPASEDGNADPRAVHRGQPPLSGTRYGATCVFREHVVDRDDGGS